MSLWVYGAAFLLLLVSGYLQAGGALHSRQAFVRASIAVSGVVFVLAVAAVVLSVRWRRSPGPEPKDPGA